MPGAELQPRLAGCSRPRASRSARRRGVRYAVRPSHLGDQARGAGHADPGGGHVQRLGRPATAHLRGMRRIAEQRLGDPDHRHAELRPGPGRRIRRRRSAPDPSRRRAPRAAAAARGARTHPAWYSPAVAVIAVADHATELNSGSQAAASAARATAGTQSTHPQQRRRHLPRIGCKVPPSHRATRRPAPGCALRQHPAAFRQRAVGSFGAHSATSRRSAGAMPNWPYWRCRMTSAARRHMTTS